MTDISFLITCFNYEKYVEKCIISCLNQRDSKLGYEIIIVDDGSTDSSLSLARKYSSKFVKVISLENSGVEKACNVGIDEAIGEYIVRVDADDYLSENYLHAIEKYLGKSDFLYSNYEEVDEGNNIIQSIELPEFEVDEILRRGDFLATGTCVKKEIVTKYMVQS